jgi:hypothetical protein
MGTTREEMIQFLEEAESMGDMETANAVLNKIEALDSQQGDMPPPVGMDFPAQELTPEKPLTIMQRIQNKGADAINSVVEPTAALVTGAVAAPIAGIYGGAQALNPFAEKGAGVRGMNYMEDALTYEPRTEAGKQGLENTGEMMEEYVGQYVDKARTGEETYEKVGDEWYGEALSTINEMAPEIVLSMLGIKSIMPTSRPTIGTSKVNKYTNRIEPTINDIPKKGATSVSAYKGVNQVAGKSGQMNWTDNAITAIRNGTAKTKTQMKQMIDIVKNRKAKGYKYAMETRPSDLAGKALLDRVKFVAHKKTAVGNQLDKMAGKYLKGQKLDFSAPMTKLQSSLNKMGIKPDGKGGWVFENSDISGMGPPTKAVNDLFTRLKEMPKNADAYEWHRVKRWVQNQVDFGKSQGGELGKVENLLKGFAKDVDGVLDGKFKVYDQFNTAYRETSTVIEDISRIAGKDFNHALPGADSQLGTLLVQRLQGNAVSRVPLGRAVDNLERVLEKYGGKTKQYKGRFDTDVHDLAGFAKEIDNVLGVQNESSFWAEIGKASTQTAKATVSPHTLLDMGGRAAKWTHDKALGVNFDNQIKAIDELLKQ